jgi:ribose/xylose/arabinose/galactoside ABC-type transport system permease subunit
MQRAWNRFLLFLFNNSIIGVLVVSCLAMGFLSDKFFTLRNWKNILDNFSVPGIVSLGVAVVVIAGGIDLSFGSILACCAILATWLQPHSLWIPVVCTILLGGFLGWINGMIVTRLDTNPLITTLGTQWLFFAILLILTRGNLVQGHEDNLFHFIGHGKIFGFPFPIYLFAATCLLAWFVLRKTQLGKYIYAHGSRKDALYCAGINSKNVYLAAFVFMGLIIGIGGLLFSSRMIGVRPTDGDQYLLRVLTGVILSGVSLNGGIGSVVNVLIAVIVLGVIDNSMVLLGIQYKNQEMIRGCVFILSIIYNNYMVKQGDILTRSLCSKAESAS